MNPQRNPLQPA